MTTTPLLACLALCMLSLHAVLAYDCGPCDCIHFVDTLVIDCTNKGLDQIPVFDNLVPASIVGLEFSGNSLTTLPDNGLSSLTNLTGVNFSNNSIITIEADAFAGQDNTLSFVELANNKLTEDQLTNINIDLLTSLTKLDLQSNSITSLAADAFNKLTKLEILNLNDNLINGMDFFAFQGLSGTLQEINLSGNQLTSDVENWFSSFSKLTKVHMNDMGLQTISSALFPLQDVTVLEEVDLQNNQLDEDSLWIALRWSNKMQTLNIRNNQIKSVNNIAFTHMTLLRELDLSNNNIEEIKYGAFPTSTGLVLNLQNNVIPDSSIQALPSNTLGALYLENNNLTTVPESKFINQEALDTIHLIGNPIVCNCSVVWMQSSDWKTTYDNWMCAEPPALAGKIFKNIPSETICQPPSSAGMTRYYLGVMIGAVGVVLGIIF